MSSQRGRDSGSASQLPVVSQRHGPSASPSGFHPTASLTAVSPTRFLGRMSWEKDMLDSTASVSYRNCKRTKPPAAPSASASTVRELPPPPSKHTLPAPDLSQSVSTPWRHEASATRGSAPMTVQESMDEVEKLLADHIRRQQEPLPRRVGSLPSQQQQRRTFTFAPLDDTRMLAEMAAQEAVDARSRTTRAGTDTDNERESTGAGVQLKYFGTAARASYYRTYRELHSKPQLFVETHASDEVDWTLGTSRGTSRCSSLTRSTGLRRSLPALDPSQISSGGGGANPNSTSSVPHSPRALFLGACLAANQAAPALVLRKERHARAFDFSHQGLGDDFIARFAVCLPELPLVEAINVAGNRLTDGGVSCLLRALENKPHLTALDVSANPLGLGASRVLRGYLRSSLCTLRVLALNDTKLSDREGARLAKALEPNKSIERLSLRSNRLGQQALTTGPGRLQVDEEEIEEEGEKPTIPLKVGQALGAMLAANLTLQQLDVSWNILRASGSSSIASALPMNYQLRELDMSHNAMGDTGALVLAQALRASARLRQLTLSYNGISPRGGVGLACGLAANASLLMLVLDGNPLGVQGGKALMHASCAPRPGAGAGATVCQLSLLECQLNTAAPLISAATGDEELHVFNPSDPAGSYVLDLGDSYEHMIAHELLRLAALQPGRYHFVRLEYLPISGSRGQSVKLEPVTRKAGRPSSEDQANVGSSSEKPSGNPVSILFRRLDVDDSGSVELGELVNALRGSGLDVSDEQLASVLQEHDYDRSGALQEREFADLFAHTGFALVDADGSGRLDADELRRVFQLLDVHDGADMETSLARMLARYDLAGTGEIDAHEFLEFMSSEVLTGVGEDVEVCEVDDVKLEVCEVGSGAVWQLPASGQLTVDLVHAVDSVDLRDVVRQQQQVSLLTSEENNSEGDMRRPSDLSLMPDALLDQLLVNASSTSRDVTEQTEFLHAVLADSAMFLSASQGEKLLARQGVTTSTAGSGRRLEALAKLLPQIVDRREASSLVTRVVDLRNQWRDRLALRRRLGSPLHNVLLGSLTNAYTFDLNREDHRAALRRLALLAQEEKQFSRVRSGRADTSQSGNWENFRSATLDGEATLLSSTSILNTLLTTTRERSVSSFLASPPSKLSFYYVSTTRPPRGTRYLSQRRFEQLLGVLAQPPDEKELAAVSADLRHETDQERAVSGSATTQSPSLLRWELVRRSVKAQAAEKRNNRGMGNANARFEQLTSSVAEIQQKLALLELLVADRWLSCQQAQELVQAFPNAVHARARAACLAFARVVDLENFIQIYDSLSMEDQTECVKRLGWLNILDPLQPDRQYPPLDLGIHDERELVQFLAQLALQEGASCWQDASYYGSVTVADKEVESTGEDESLVALPPAGWGRPDAVGVDSLKHHGTVCLRYHSTGANQDSGEDLEKACEEEAPVDAHRDAARRALRDRVLCGSRLFL